MSDIDTQRRDWHKNEAVRCFNSTWDLLEKTDRTEAENRQMIHMAHASRFHWGEIGTPLQFGRGEWQVSRVYATLDMGENRNCITPKPPCNAAWTTA